MADLVWLQGASDTGCSISVLNAEQPDIAGFLDKFGVNIAFHPTLSQASGPATQRILEKYSNGKRGLDILVVEGAIPLGPANTGTYCLVGDMAFKQIVAELASVASYTIAIGTCASFGGIPAAEPNPTDATGLQFHRDKIGGLLGKDYRSKSGLPVINISGCPVHPEWVVKTLAQVLSGRKLELDRYNRPKEFFDDQVLVHSGCPRNEYFDYGLAAEKFGDRGCLFINFGCNGAFVVARCNDILWNRQSSCTRAGSPCVGCTSPNFPDEFLPFFKTKKILAIPRRLPIKISPREWYKRPLYILHKFFGKLAKPGRLKNE
jgi:hydrogenase small subunit